MTTITATKKVLYLLTISLFLSALFISNAETIEDEELTDRLDNCDELLKKGICQKDPDKGLEYCRKSCHEWVQSQVKHESFRLTDDSFFELSATTARGELLEFERLRDYITVIVNMNKACKRSLPDEKKLEDYFHIIEDIRTISPYTLEIVAFPYYNPTVDYSKEDCTMWDKAASSPKRKVNVMETVHLQGDKMHGVFKYLAKTANVTEFDANVATFFVVNPAGTILQVLQGMTVNMFMDFIRQRLKDYDEL